MGEAGAFTAGVLDGDDHLPLKVGHSGTSASVERKPLVSVVDLYILKATVMDWSMLKWT